MNGGKAWYEKLEKEFDDAVKYREDGVLERKSVARDTIYDGSELTRVKYKDYDMISKGWFVRTKYGIGICAKTTRTNKITFENTVLFAKGEERKHCYRNEVQCASYNLNKLIDLSDIAIIKEDEEDYDEDDYNPSGMFPVIVYKLNLAAVRTMFVVGIITNSYILEYMTLNDRANEFQRRRMRDNKAEADKIARIKHENSMFLSIYNQKDWDKYFTEKIEYEY